MKFIGVKGYLVGTQIKHYLIDTRASNKAIFKVYLKIQTRNLLFGWMSYSGIFINFYAMIANTYRLINHLIDVKSYQLQKELSL